MPSFRKLAKITLVLVYLVIVAGAVVRMTGSGMGCPDWPKCFGYYIPPTDVEQLLWKPNHDYKKGQIIIVDETLKVAIQNFHSSTAYNTENWRNYTKHDYAIFNPTHTWVEYINRLFGALSGFATLLLAFASLKYIRKKPWLTALSFFLVFAMGFQAWLGATVVYSVLNPVKITLHMLMALAIVAILLYIIYKTGEQKRIYTLTKSTKMTIYVALALILLQIGLGTQVRQWVDHFSVVSSNGFQTLDIPVTFYVHRSLSMLILGINIYLWFLLRKEKSLLPYQNWGLFTLILITFSGVAMYYFHFPFGMQSLHLVASSVVFGIQCYMALKTQRMIT